MLDDNEHELHFKTLFYRENFLNSADCPKMLHIWNLKTLAIFLNEQSNFLIKEHSITINKEGHPTFHFKSKMNDEYQMSITISDFIYVNVSISMLVNEWNRSKLLFYSNIGSRNYILKNYRLQFHIQFYYSINNLSFGSKTLLYKHDFVYNSKYDFSKIFIFLVNV